MNNPFALSGKKGLKAHLVETEKFANKYRPELRLQAHDIHAVYKDVRERCPELLHSNGNKVTLKPWQAESLRW